MKIFSIVGTRPQFIKVAALHREIVGRKNLQHYIFHTGQHYDDNLSEIFFTELGMPKPSFHLNIEDRSLASSVKHMEEKIERIFSRESPDIVIVFGDTNSTLAGALAAKNKNIRLAHIEAGLRSFNNLMPEEINRIATDNISNLLFCPTTIAMANLAKEQLNRNDQKIILSGDIMLDAYNYYFKKKIERKINKSFPSSFILCTLHRHTLVNSPDKMREIIKSLNEINRKIPIILPAHPSLRNTISQLGLQTDFIITEPVGYLEMIDLLRCCTLVITDSGGLQKEAFFSKKVCITLRNETEWTELVASGVNFLAGDSSSEKIIKILEKAIDIKANFKQKFYGDGNAAEIIVNEIISDSVKKDDE